jgi:tetratricopeptide (TPR) repeat protein/ABC-type cobalamin/Fe3+-siderophores transport system ATPase subunit
MLTAPETEVVVARERELAKLNGYLDWAMTGQGSAVFVTGEAGAGKTTLIKEFIRQAQQNNDELLFAMGNCNAQTGMSDPYLPFREILSLLTGDVEAKLAQGSITSEGGQRLRKFFQISGEVLVEFGPALINTLVPGAGLVSRFGVFAAKKLGWLDKLKKLTTTEMAEKPELSQEHIFEQYTAVLQAIALRRPLVLWLDDLHWVDSASASLLFHLGRALEKSRILVLGAYRFEDVALGRDAEPHPLADVVNEFKRYWGDIQIDLDLARASEGRHFVDALLDAQPNALDEPFRQALFKHTGGLPLFTVELLRDLQERAELVPDAGGHLVVASTLDWNALPARIEGIIEKRIGRLDSDLQETLITASIEGERFTVEIVAQVRNRPARELVLQLSGAADKKHRLVQAMGSQRVGHQRLSLYQFRHSLIQKYLYNRLDAVERAYLHEEMGYALEAFCADQSEVLEAQLEKLAYHFHAAAVWPKAQAYAQRAGEKALALHAPQAAIEEFTRALDAANQLAQAPPPELYYLRGRAYDTLGNFDLAKFDYEAALEATQAARDQRLTWQILLDLGLLWASRDYEITGAYCRQALDLARTLADPAAIGHSLNRLGNWLMNGGQPLSALEYHQEALGLFESLDDRPGIAATLDLLAMTSNMCGQLTSAITYYERAIPILRALNDLQTLSSSLTNLSLFTLDEAPALEAIELAREIEFRAGEAYALGNLGFIAAFKGDYGRALSVGKNALALAQEIEHRLWQASVEIILGFIYLELMVFTEACLHLERGHAIASETGARFFSTFAATLLASTFIQQGDLDKAAELLPEMPFKPVMAIDHMWFKPAMELALARRDASRVLHIHDESNNLVQVDWLGSMANVAGSFLHLRGRALLLLGRFDEAEAALNEVLELYRQQGVRTGLWRVYLTLGELFRAKAELARADAAFAQTRTIIEELTASLADDTLREAFRQQAMAMIPLA